jgi:hypothetical protein
MIDEAEAEDAGRADMALFFSRNHSRLMPLYDARAAGRRGSSFCWPGFLAPQAWFLYRKMYLWAALVSAGPLLLAFVPQFSWLTWSTALIGACGLRSYLAHAEATVARIRATTADEMEARALIVRAGGVSRVGAAIGLVFVFSAFVLSLKAGAPHIFAGR